MRETGDIVPMTRGENTGEKVLGPEVSSASDAVILRE